MSLYLKMNRRRFASSMGEVEGDYVPWYLDDKVKAYEHVSERGFRTPALETFDSVTSALAGATGRFVIKGAGGHSGKNVFILERFSEDKFLDLMAAKIWSLSAIVEAARKRPAEYWIREECVESTVYGRTIPFDYKIDCFRGQIVAITQIDRNFWPPRVAIFDGAFVPMRASIDYKLDTSRWMYGAPVVPLQSSRMVRMARDLSLSTNSDYVRVDLFDGFSEPVFGEFTFASGPPDVGMVKFSDKVLAEFDNALVGRQISRVSGFDINYLSYWRVASDSSEELSVQDSAIYRRIAASASIGDHRYWQQVEIAPKGPLGDHYSFCIAVATALSGNGQVYFHIQEAIRVQAGFIDGDSSESEYLERALTFHNSRKHLGDWHVARHAEVFARRGDIQALSELRKVADSGYEYAKRALERLTSTR